MFNLIISEYSDFSQKVTVRAFNSCAMAKEAMMRDFNAKNNISHFPTEVKDETRYTSICEYHISVRDAGDMYDWTIEEIVPEDTDFEALLKRHPELEMYDDDHQTDLLREPDDVPGNELGRYEIVFDVDGQRYYCFADAVNMDEALGQFFQKHPTMTYDDIFEHMEI